MALVNVTVTMSNGTGLGLFIKVDNNVLHFNGSGVQTINLIPQSYIATVGGHEPSSATTVIDFVENGSSIGSQSFSTPTFFGFIPFTVV